jgi:hypothetical protein
MKLAPPRIAAADDEGSETNVLAAVSETGEEVAGVPIRNRCSRAARKE